MLTPSQIDQLLETIRQQNIVFVAKQLGPNYLTQDELIKLRSIGIDPSEYYAKGGDILTQSFHFGLISDALGKDAKSATLEQLQEYFKTGQHIPLTAKEQFALDSVKKQFLGDIKAQEGRVFKDINQIINNKERNNRKAYEDVIREQVSLGLTKKQTNAEIAREIARKTGDWSRDFTRIVEYVSHQALDEGRAAAYERAGGPDVQVYKSVYQGACKHCIRLYLTNGIGSEPKIFKLSTLINNGSNIGRKTAELQPVVGCTHPYCFDDKTEVLTNQGWKFFKDLNKTELFLSINLQSGEGEWTKAVNWIDEHYEGPMHWFKNKSFDLMTTPNHHHVIKTPKARYLRLVETKDLVKTTQFLKHMPRWKGTEVEKFVFNKREFKPSDFCEFMGFYLSEGCVINYKGRKRIHISQSLEKYYEDIFSVCQRMFGTSVYKCQGYIQVNLINGDEELFQYLSLGKSFEKSIPENIKELNQELLEIFLNAFCKGDGSFRKGRRWDNYQCRDSREFFTSSKRMSDDLGEIILKLGKNPSYKTKPAGLGVYDKKQEKAYCSNHPMYVISELTNQYTALGHANETIVSYQGHIYDVELEKNHTLFVRREGKVCVSGNCRCTLNLVPQQYEWNKKDRAFTTPVVRPEKQRQRAPVRFIFNGKQYSA